MKKFIFGPVPSRRLGFSLGVDIIPYKYCNFDCVYCQIGRTTETDAKRQRFFGVEEVVREIENAVTSAERIDFITFSGSGEPTLNENLGAMVAEVKKRVATPVAVITNSSLLSVPEVRQALGHADVVLPSLDAGSDETFRRVNRPQTNVTIEDIVKGMKAFREHYRGLMWLEIMLIKGFNDTPGELEKLRAIVSKIKTDKVHLNTVTRPPSERFARPLALGELEDVKRFFGGECEIISSFAKNGLHEKPEGWPGMLVEVLKRRSLTLEDIVKITGVSLAQVKGELSEMEGKGTVKAYRLGNEVYYTVADCS